MNVVYPQHYDMMLVDMAYMKDVLPLDQVKVPTHIIHGDTDNDVPYS